MPVVSHLNKSFIEKMMSVENKEPKWEEWPENLDDQLSAADTSQNTVELAAADGNEVRVETVRSANVSTGSIERDSNTAGSSTTLNCYRSDTPRSVRMLTKNQYYTKQQFVCSLAPTGCNKAPARPLFACCRRHSVCVSLSLALVACIICRQFARTVHTTAACPFPIFPVVFFYFCRFKLSCVLQGGFRNELRTKNRRRASLCCFGSGRILNWLGNKSAETCTNQLRSKECEVRLLIFRRSKTTAFLSIRKMQVIRFVVGEIQNDVIYIKEGTELRLSDENEGDIVSKKRVASVLINKISDHRESRVFPKR